MHLVCESTSEKLRKKKSISFFALSEKSLSQNRIVWSANIDFSNRSESVKSEVYAEIHP